MNERAELRELLEANKVRLHKLQLKKAEMGLDTPPHCIIEMEKIKEEIHRLESQISQHDDGSITSNDISTVVGATIEQLKRAGTGGKVTICVLEIQLGSPALEM